MMDMAARAICAENELKKRELSKMKAIAAGLLVLAACLYALGRYLGVGYLSAFAEAAMIGALADWFAVVALFRHPLGLPIPHTSILSRNKQSIANGLADFVVEQFLSERIIAQRLGRFDAALHLARWLPQNRVRVSDYLKLAVIRGVAALDDKRIHDFLAAALRSKLQSIDLSGLMADGLALITKNQSHHKILHGGLNRFADYVESPDNTEKIAAFIKGWSENAFVQSMIEPFVPAIRSTLVAKLRAAAEDETNGLYLEFDAQVQGYLSRLQEDEQLQEWMNLKKMALLNHPDFGLQIESLWTQLKDWVVLDLSHSESVIAEKIAQLLQSLEHHLANNEEIRDWLNDQIQTALISAANANKGVVGEMIREEFAGWDDKYMVDRLELYLGRDLQYIRLNGTLVGGLFGLLIYAVSSLIWGGV